MQTITITIILQRDTLSVSTHWPMTNPASCRSDKTSCAGRVVTVAWGLSPHDTAGGQPPKSHEDHEQIP
jgi:hypothetical protein